MTFADDLREARVRAGLTQTELANQLGVTLRSVGSWENGQKISPANRMKAEQFIQSVRGRGESDDDQLAGGAYKRETDFGDSPGKGELNRMRATRRWDDVDGGQHVLELIYTHPDPGNPEGMTARVAAFMSAITTAQHELGNTPPAVEPASAGGEVVELGRGELPADPGVLAARTVGLSPVERARQAQDDAAERGE